MHKARVYFRILPVPSDQAPVLPASPIFSQDGRDGFNETTIMRFIRDPTHRHEIIVVADKTHQSVAKLLAERFPRRDAVIESVMWLT
jgi:hypothetical protein